MQGDGNFTGCGEKIPVFTVVVNDILRKTIRQLIGACRSLTVCGEANSSEETVQQIENSPITPKVVLLDIFYPEADTAFIPRLKAYYPNIQVLCVSGHFEPGPIYLGLAAGAGGYLMKDELALDLLPKAIHDLNRGVLFISPMAQALLDREAKYSQWKGSVNATG